MTNKTSRDFVAPRNLVDGIAEHLEQNDAIQLIPFGTHQVKLLL